MELKTSDFDYYLPNELIAQNPIQKRENCKMLHLNKTTGVFEDKHFYDILDYLNKDDILVLNDTKVYKARLNAKRKTGANVEIFLLNPASCADSQSNSQECYFEALTKNAKHVKSGEILDVTDDFKIELVKRLDVNNINEIPKYVVRLDFKGDDVYKVLDKYGSIPLPPYITRKDNKDDVNNYQTVYAKNLGSVACPTAGLHFSKELLQKIKQKGVKIAYVTLNVGLGTFMPIKCDNIKDHTMHYESFSIPFETQKIIEEKPDNSSLIAVGTTVLRCLEATIKKHGKIIATNDSTNIFIYPPYEIKSVDKLITNFHLPKSTLIMLVSAFASKDLIFSAYNHAIENKYRFFSYGDCMFIDK